MSDEMKWPTGIIIATLLLFFIFDGVITHILFYVVPFVGISLLVGFLWVYFAQGEGRKSSEINYQVLSSCIALGGIVAVILSLYFTNRYVNSQGKIIINVVGRFLFDLYKDFATFDHNFSLLAKFLNTPLSLHFYDDVTLIKIIAFSLGIGVPLACSGIIKWKGAKMQRLEENQPKHVSEDPLAPLRQENESLRENLKHRGIEIQRLQVEIKMLDEKMPKNRVRFDSDSFV